MNKRSYLKVKTGIPKRVSGYTFRAPVMQRETATYSKFLTNF